MIENFIKENRKFKNIKFRLVKLKKNSGKGAAIKNGVAKSKNKWILTSDIDFSVPLSELERWIRKNYLKKKNLVYFGSRTHEKSNVNSKFYRKIIGNFLRYLISSILGIKIKDTQCGFKLYEASIAKKLFKKIKFYGYEHDIDFFVT